jgi:aspartyl-tRNA(Asn)/glutamyl-tRNA(Gln) amidotransferase subunit A
MLNKLTLKQALDKLDKKEITLEEIYFDTKKEIEKNNKNLNIYLNLDENAKTKAESLKDKPLKGLPIAVKDNYCTKNLKTTASSKVLDSFSPEYNATVINNLEKNGGIVLGKTNLDAWAHGSSTETSDYGRTLNPRNPSHLPGGSSGGSAAAVAADMCLASLGSETAGSIRQPASWCGVVGLKPTYGRCSRYGVIAMASSTDSPGPIGKTVEDCSILLNQIASHDKFDATSSSQEIPDFTSFLNQDIKGLKIGLIYHDISEIKEIYSTLEREIKVLEKLGAKIEYAKALDPHYAIGLYTVVQRGEVSSNLARFDGVRFGNGRDLFGAEAKRRIMLGTYTLSKGYADQYYVMAQKVRTLFIQDYEKLFNKHDVLIAPTSPGYAKKIGASENSALFGELEDMLLEASSVTGLPGCSVPYYHDPKTNLYLGMNIIAPMWREDLVIKVADAFEKNTNWNSWRKNEE